MNLTPQQQQQLPKSDGQKKSVDGQETHPSLPHDPPAGTSRQPSPVANPAEFSALPAAADKKQQQLAPGFY